MVPGAIINAINYNDVAIKSVKRINSKSLRGKQPNDKNHTHTQSHI